MVDASGGESEVPIRPAAELAEKLRLVETLAGVGHWRFCLSSRKIEWSPQVYRIHGLEPFSFDPNFSDVLAAYHPEDREVLRRHVERAEATGEGYAFKLRLNRMSDGVERIVAARAAVLLDENFKPLTLFGVFQDVTESEGLLQRLSESEALYRLLAEHSTDVVVRAGPNGVIRFASPSCRLFGVSPEEAVGRSTLDFVIDEDKEFAARLVSELFSGSEPDRSVRREFRVRAGDGEILWVEGNPSIVRDAVGRPVEFVTSFRDVTARRALEDELARARDAAEAALRVKAGFLANVSHELRTPLTSVLGFARALGERVDLPEDARRNARQISEAGAALLSVVNDLLDAAALDAGAVRLIAAPFSIRLVAQSALDLLAEEARAKAMTLSLDVADAASEMVMGDALRLRQVLINLVSNGLKYASSGSVRVGVDRLPAGNVVRFTVADDGPGVPDALKASIFERFERGGGGAAVGGAGLGLAICKEIVSLMGGAIGVDNGESGGAVFWFAAPLPGADRSEWSNHARAGDAGPKRVLLIEDHPNIQEIVRQILIPLGHVVEVAGDGAAGLVAAAAGGFDVILVDGSLPDTTGAALTSAIRSLGGAAGSAPIVALSAFSRADALPSFIAAGVDLYLSKPINVRELIAVVQNPPNRGAGGQRGELS